MRGAIALGSAVLALVLWIGLPGLAKSTLTHAETPLIWRNWGAGPGYLIVWFMFTPVAVIMSAVLGLRLATRLGSRPKAFGRRPAQAPKPKRSFALSQREIFTILSQVLLILIPGLLAVSSYNERDAEAERWAAEKPRREAQRRAELEEQARADFLRRYPDLARGRLPAAERPRPSAEEDPLGVQAYLGK